MPSRSFILLYLAILFWVSGYSQCSESEILNLKRTALIFGEKNYKYANPLVNPLNDARDIADSLRKIGFVVNVLFDGDLATMNTAIDRWCSTLARFNVAMLYYSGHGAEYNSENYLFPIDARPHSATEMSVQCISANQLLSRIENSNVHYSIMILDACRSNPFTRAWNRGLSNEGLAAMVGRGSFIGYAAAPGATASDGLGQNGTYTEGILKYITIPDLPIDEIFTRVNSYVQSSTKGDQIPYKTSSLNSDFCFSVRRSSAKQTDKFPGSLFQPPSSALITGDQLYLINTIDSGVAIKDALTLSNLNIIRTDSGHAYEIASRGTDIVYAIDSSHNRLFEFSVSMGARISEVFLNFRPTAIAISGRQEKVYIGFQGRNSAGFWCYSLGKDIPDLTRNFKFIPRSLAVSNDDKTLYILSEDTLYLYNLKLDKIERKISGFNNASVLGLSPNNKFLLVSGVVQGEARLLIFEASSSICKGQIPLTGSTISFTPDGLYAYVGSGSDLFVISLEQLSIINRTSVSSEISGIAVSSDNAGLIWLPKENRFYLYSYDQLVNKSDLDLEMKLKDFVASEKKDYKTDSAKSAELWALFDKMRHTYDSTVTGIAIELGNPYHIKGHGSLFDGSYVWGFVYPKRMFGGDIRISSFGEQRSIYTYYLGMVDSGEFVLQIYDRPGSKNPPSVFKASLQQLDWNKMSKFVRKYFLERLDQLKE